MDRLRCLVLLCLFSIAKAQPFYIIAPNSLRVDSDEVIGIAIDGDRGALVNFYIQDHPGKIKNITQKQIDVRPGHPSTFKIHLNPRDFPPSFLRDTHSENIVSLTAHCELFHKEILLPVNFNGGYVFIQTDKPIYTPRDRAHFRIISLGENVLPSDKPFVLQIKNPQNIVVEETTFNKKAGTAFFSHKYNFPTYAINGEWSATVKYGHELGENTTVRFILREYVLPTFTVELKTQDVILETAEFITVSVNAKYVYGKKVKGLVTFRFGVQGETPEAVMFGLMGPEQLDEGSHILRLPTSEIKQHKDIGWFPEIEGSHLIVEATVVDDATGKKEKAYSSKAIFSKSPFVISFKRSLRDFKPGLVSILEANVNFVDGKPASGILTKITAKVNGEVLKIKHDTAVSDDEGKVSFKLQPEMHHEIVSITVETIDPKYNGSQAVGHHEQYKFKSNNNAYLALERSSGQKLKPGDGFLKLVHIHPPEISDIYYVVVSKGQIISMNKLPPGKFLLHKVEFDITYDMVPSFRLVVFAHYNDELIADSLQIDVQHVCHPEAEVTINPEFDDQSPGAAGKIILRGQRDTLVGLLGVDEAVYAISKRDLLTKAKVFNTFNKHDLGCGAGGGLNTDSVLNNAGVVLTTDKYSPPLDRSSSCVEKKRQKRDIGSDILSAYTGIERECCALGMNHDTRGRSCEDRTNIVVRYLKGGHKNCSRAFLGCCLEALERGFTEMKVDEQTGRSGRPLVPEIDFIPINEEHIFEKDLFLRTDFKEVWIFQDVTISAGNKHELSLSLPHSITTWVIQAVSVSQTHGICVAEPKKVLSFKKIFLQLDLPYSVVRNEQVEIPATIFNYGHKRLSVIMYMYGVEHLCTGTKKDEKSERKRLIVEGQSAVTATFPVIPLKEGEFDIRVVALSAEGSDAIMRKLHVVPEGYPDGIDFSIKLDPSNMQRRKRRFVGNNRYTDSIDESQNLQVTAIKLHVPQDFVPGTESCVITALGDQLGPAVDTTINNPDKLLTKPRGCGEQNMMFLAPTLYTMRYLKVKGKITPEIEEKGYGYIRQGYGNQLAFRKEDGSYAAYQHKPTSTWLTAFVMKVFCQANELIHIDENVLCTGIKWLIDNQQPDGSYIESHPMYHLDMMGGVQGKTPMTAFALIALEECKCDAENLHLAKKRAVAFLEQHLGEVNEALPVAIVAYALALDESDLKDAAHDKLLTLAMHDEDANMLYWDTGNPARNIEATAYGLLNLLLFNDMMRSASIVNWLNSQQLQSGSFQSTQDTVIALQALAEYAIRAQMPPINLVSNITSSNDRNFHKVLAFHEGNSMVLQDVEVRKIGGTLFINTAGHGVGSLSVKLRYNVNRPPEQICKFDVTVNVTEATGEAKEADPLDPQLGKLDPLVPSNNDVFNLLEADLIRGMGQALDKEEDAEPVFVGDPRNRQPASLVATVPEKEIRVKRENAAANSKLIYKISICARYLGDKTAEMSIVDVGLFSGFEPEERDLELLQNSADGMIQRYEKSKRGIVFYLQTVPRDNKYCFSFHVTRQFIVGGTQASVIKVYDYYSPGYSCTVFYSPASNSPLLHTICEGGICQCAEGGCPPNEPFEEIRKIHSLSDRREKLLDAACENYHYVWKGKVLENTKKAGIFLNITFFIEKVIKEGTEKAELIEGETRTLLLRDTCASSEPFPNSEYLIMGKDGQKYKDDNDQIWHRYMLDKNSVIYLWNSISKAQYPDLQRDLNHVTRKLKKNGCNG